MAESYGEWKEAHRFGEAGSYPWEIGRPRGFLVGLVEKGMIRGHRALDTCCGLGTNGLYLAEKGAPCSWVLATWSAAATMAATPPFMSPVPLP